MPTAVERVCIVTGGTGRLGSAVAKGLVGSYDRIIVLGRNEARGQALVESLREVGAAADFRAVDLADLRQVQRFCSSLGGRAIHGLVLLAGVTALEHREETSEGYERHFAVNYLSRFHMVACLMENLKKGGSRNDAAKVLLCGSSRHRGEPLLGFSGLGPALPVALGDFEDLQLESPGAYRPWKAFGQAALCNVMFAYELERRLEATDVAVCCFDPGPMTTAWLLYRQEENRWRSSGMSELEKELFSYFTRLVRAPEEAAVPVVALARDLRPRSTQVGFATYQEQGMPALSKFPLPWNWGDSYDEALWTELWQISEQLCGLRP